MAKSIIIICCSCCLFFSCSRKGTGTRPNILLIVADDLGYSDLGCFGSEIRTPNMDALAASGIRFSQFHTSPYCAPTRAMLLTGQNNHVAGMGNQGGAAPGSKRYGVPGYEGHLSDRVIPFPRLLQAAGYHTYMAGKWHLGHDEKDSPRYRGFDKSFCLLQGGANHFNSVGFEPDDSISLYREDGVLVNYPDGQYSTDVYTNKLIDYIGSRQDADPFFAYAAYTSPHWPLQVPNDYLDKYKGQYDMGYDSLRIMRHQSLINAGIIPASSPIPPALNNIKPWAQLTNEERRIESRKMELYAAMVENLDYHIGRLVDYLKKNDLYENTLIIFMSDNGAGAEDFYNQGFAKEFLRRHYNNTLETMGTANSFVSYGPQWAYSSVAAFNRHKSYTTEGGITAPLIATGPGIKPSGTAISHYLTILDLAPTFLELANISFPSGGAVHALPGQSLLPVFSEHTSVHNNQYATGLEHRGRMFFRQGPWKLVQIEGPYDENQIKLFDLSTDPTETTDVKSEYPEKFEQLMADWKTYIARNGIEIVP